MESGTRFGLKTENVQIIGEIVKHFAQIAGVVGIFYGNKARYAHLKKMKISRNTKNFPSTKCIFSPLEDAYKLLN